MRFLVLCVCGFLLASCGQPEKDSAYLLAHPFELQKAVLNCEKATSLSSAESDRCDDVMKTAQTFRAILDEYQAGPEQFGQAILQTQMDIASTQQELTNLEKQFSVSKEAALQEKITTMQTKLADLKQQAAEKLAVIGINSPE